MLHAKPVSWFNAKMYLPEQVYPENFQTAQSVILSAVSCFLLRETQQVEQPNRVATEIFRLYFH